MSTRVHVGAYRIERCGYYKRGSDEPSFGACGELVEALIQWVQPKPFGETCTFIHTEEGEEDREQLMCCDYAQVGEDYLFQMWQRASGADGTLASVAADAAVGDAEARDVDIDEGRIPGTARLFWILPTANLLCTVRIAGNRATSLGGFRRYIIDFLKARSRWTRTEQTDSGLRVLGWAQDTSSEPERYVPSFTLSLSPDEATVDRLRRQHASIRRILYKGQVERGRGRQVLGPIDELLARFALVSGSIADPKPFTVHIELPGTPSLEELNQIIAQAREDETGAAAAVGFRLDPYGETVWLNAKRTWLSDRIDVPWRNSAQVETDSLLRELHRRFRNRLVPAARDG